MFLDDEIFGTDVFVNTMTELFIEILEGILRILLNKKFLKLVIENWWKSFKIIYSILNSKFSSSYLTSFINRARKKIKQISNMHILKTVEAR